MRSSQPMCDPIPLHELEDYKYLKRGGGREIITSNDIQKSSSNARGWSNKTLNIFFEGSKEGLIFLKDRVVFLVKSYTPSVPI